MALSLLLSLCHAIANGSSECAALPGATCTCRYRPVWIRVVTLLSYVSLCGCSGFGTTRFYQDQLGYSRAVGDAEKSNTLLNTVRLRYGDTPVILQPTQVISGYQLQQNVTGGFEAFPAANPSTFLNGSASAQLQQSPTFTFQPLSGAQFAQSFINHCRRPTFYRLLWVAYRLMSCSGYVCNQSMDSAMQYRWRK